MSELKNITTESKNKKKLTMPKGATELSREVSINIEEIENGYIISKRTEVKYQLPDKGYTDYTSCTRKFYSEECPEVDVAGKDKELADLFKD